MEQRAARAKDAEVPEMALSIDSRMEPHTDYRLARDCVAAIDAAYKDYISLLNDEINDLVGLAHVHGWRSRRVEDGKLGRERIARALALWQTEVDWHEGRALDSLDEPHVPSDPSGGDSSNAVGASSPNSESSNAQQPMEETFLEWWKTVWNAEGFKEVDSRTAEKFWNALRPSTIKEQTEKASPPLLDNGEQKGSSGELRDSL